MENNTFEEKLKSLENTVRKLEENDLSLDHSNDIYYVKPTNINED